MTTTNQTILVDLFLDNARNYECLCDVPHDVRVWQEECEHNNQEPNSMLIKFKDEDSLQKFEDEMGSQPHILYAVGREINETK